MRPFMQSASKRETLSDRVRARREERFESHVQVKSHGSYVSIINAPTPSVMPFPERDDFLHFFSRNA